MGSLYDKLSVDFLSSFHYEIKRNIEKGILTEAMYVELDLIEKAAVKKGVNAKELYKYRLDY